MATIYVGSARIAEDGTSGWNGKAKAGDQTGKEVSQQKFYVHSKGWVVLRPKSIPIAEKIAKAMIAACNNPNIGYDQSQRDGVWKYGVNTTVKCETDCSALVRACIREASGVDVGNIRTVSEPKMLEASGLFNKRFTYVSQSKTPIYNGDVLCTPVSGHTVVVTKGSPRPGATPTETNGNPMVMTGQKEACDFTGHPIEIDGYYGPETKKAGIRCVQRAMNLDYNLKLEIDGVWGPKSEKALKGHYVKYGEKQYLVTAVEILAYMQGLNPNGVEYPGIYGNGLKKATGYDKCTDKIIKKMMGV